MHFTAQCPSSVGIKSPEIDKEEPPKGLDTQRIVRDRQLNPINLPIKRRHHLSSWCLSSSTLSQLPTTRNRPHHLQTGCWVRTEREGSLITHQYSIGAFPLITPTYRCWCICHTRETPRNKHPSESSTTTWQRQGHYLIVAPWIISTN